MNDQRKTKRSLTANLMILLTCIAMLIVATYAWFTDSASTGVNRIEAGTLKVDIVKAGTNESVVGKALNWKIADGAQNTEVLHEPGATYDLEPIQIVNKGNLALKYKIEITGINGTAKLNDAIEWTINNADENTEYSLGAGETSNTITISGHMKEEAGNEYQNEIIDNIAITVYATQDTVEYDSTTNQYDKNSSASKTVEANQDTVLSIQDSNNSELTLTAPAGSTDANSLTLIQSEGTTPSTITAVTNTTDTTIDLQLINQDGQTVKAKDGSFFILNWNIGMNQNFVGLYHYDIPMTFVSSEEEVSKSIDTYYYNSSTGILTFSTDDFSPFTYRLSTQSFCSGGSGTKNDPYLISTGAQAVEIGTTNNSGVYYKLVQDIVTNNEIVIQRNKKSKRTVTLDLNGHSIQLVYGEGITPEDGGTISVRRNCTLTINDSSSDQTGAVYGYNQAFEDMDKVICAVRLLSSSTVVINGGHFYGTAPETSCIFTRTSQGSSDYAKLTINGGVFETTCSENGISYVLNHQDNDSYYCKMTINGGSFKNYNPGVTQVDNGLPKTGKIELGKNCTTSSYQDGSDTWYVVSKS